MVLHAGAVYADGEVSLRPPLAEAMRPVAAAGDVPDELEQWLPCATARDDIYYFAVHEGEAAVGQIFLHDIDAAAREVLVGYHLFAPAFRGRGIGTKALRLLQRFVLAETDLRALVVITTRDNHASQTIARRCGFVEAGAPWEDREHGVVFRWLVPDRAPALQLVCPCAGDEKT